MKAGRTFQAEGTEVRGRPCLTFRVCRESDLAGAGMQFMSRPTPVVMVAGEGGGGEWSLRVFRSRQKD